MTLRKLKLSDLKKHLETTKALLLTIQKVGETLPSLDYEPAALRAIYKDLVLTKMTGCIMKTLKKTNTQAAPLRPQIVAELTAARAMLDGKLRWEGELPKAMVDHINSYLKPPTRALKNT